MVMHGANITDFDGPATGAWVRSAQIAYQINLDKKQHITVSIENPLTDYSRYLVIDSLVQTCKPKLS